jgi:hypothetical protein
VSFGKESLLYEGDGNNPQGYYEHRMATLINLRILEEFQMHVTSFTGLPENWREFPQSIDLRAALRDFIRDEFRQDPVWGIKQPLTSLVLPIYNDVFAELNLRPHYVVCVRNPLETMDSESRLDFEGGYRVMSSLGKMAIGSWLRYTLGSVCDAAPYPVTVVMYDELLSNPRSVLERIAAKQEGWAPTEESWADAVASIRTDLRHNQRAEEQLEDYPSIVGRTYRAARVAAGTEAFDSFQELYREFKSWARMLGDPGPAPGKLWLSWLEDGSQRFGETDFVVTNEWQTVRLVIEAPPRSSLAGLLYGLPARVWIRECVWKSSDRVHQASIRCGPASQITDVHGVLRLDVAPEPQQIQLTTPKTAGPYVLEIELLLETGPMIQLASANRLSRQLEQCVSNVEALSKKAR